MAKLELPIRLTYEPMRGGGWEVHFPFPPQVIDYEAYMINNLVN